MRDVAFETSIINITSFTQPIGGTIVVTAKKLFNNFEQRFTDIALKTKKFHEHVFWDDGNIFSRTTHNASSTRLSL